MNWKKILSRNGLIYIILDLEFMKGKNIKIINFLKNIVKSPADLFQLRTKHTTDIFFLSLAKKMAEIIHKEKKIFIINNRCDIASLVDAGVHLGEDDLPTKFARKILPKKILGRTIHSPRELKSHLKEDIDYFSIGPIFPSPLKPELSPLKKNVLKKLIELTSFKPTFAIGGINKTNIHQLLPLGTKNIALSSAVIASKNPYKKIEEIKKCLKRVS